MQTKKRLAAMTIGITVGLGAAGSSIAQDKSDNLQEIVVTGSRIRGVASVDTPTPVTTLSADEILGTGALSIGDVLNELPALRSTFTSANSSRFIGTAGLSLLDLRGLGAERTLVLVNGRRHVSAFDGTQFVDTNLFGGDLLERVEVITGGASSVYGSDAIAGVVNFIERRDYEGFGVNLQTGMSSRSDNENSAVSATWGLNFAEGRGNVAVSGEYAREEAISFDDRTFGRQRKQNVLSNPDSMDLDGDGVPDDDGIPDRIFVGDTRTVNLTPGGVFNPRQQDDFRGVTRRPENNQARLFNFNTDGTLSEFDYGARDFRPSANSTAGGTGGTLREVGDLTPELERKSITLLTHYDVNDAVSLFGEVRAARTDTYSLGQNGPSFNSVAGGNGIVVNLDNPFLTDQARSVVSQFLAPDATSFVIGRNNVDLGSRGEDTNRETIRVVTGVKGDLSDHLSYEVSLNFGRTEVDTHVLGNRLEDNFLLAVDAVRAANGTIVCRARLNAAGVVVQSGDPVVDNCVPINVLGAGNISREGRSYVNAFSTKEARLQQQVATGFVSYDTGSFFELPGGPIGVVAGLEYRDEASRAGYSPEVENGLTFLNAIQAVDEDYSVKEVFAELRLPLLRGLPGVEELTVNGSMRLADYSLQNTDTIETWNASVQWAPIRDVRFRAAVSKSVRTPTIGDLFDPLTQNFATILDPCDVRFLGNGTSTRAANCLAAGLPANFMNTLAQAVTPEIRSGGNPGLTEEEARSVTLGVVLQPRFVPGLAITVDYYDINVKSVISQVDAQQIVDNCYDSASLDNMFCPLVFRDPATGFFFGRDNPGPIGGGVLQSSLNFAGLVAKGIDAEIAYSFDWERVGRISTRFLGSYVRQKDEFPFLDDPRRPDQFLEELGDPKYEFGFNLGLDRGPFAFNYSMRWIESQYIDEIENIRFVGGMAPRDPDFSATAFTGSQMYHDVRLSYRMNSKLSGYFGIDNLTDEKPPFGLTGVGMGSSIYSNEGQFFYGGLKWKL